MNLLKYLRLGSALPMAQLGEAADAHATKILERWDVPHEIDGVPVPDDIDDRDPRWWRTRDGRRITGLTMVNEAVFGAPSIATPTLIALIPLLTLFTSILALIPYLGALALPLGVVAIATVTVALVIAEGYSVALGTLFLGAIVPLAGTAYSGPMAQAMFRAGPWSLAVIAGVVVLAAFVVLVLRGSLDKARVALCYFAGLALTLLVALLLSLKFPWLQTFTWFLFGAGLPWAWSHLSWLHYVDRQVVQDSTATAESSQNAGEGHIQGRIEQAKAVLRDTTPVFDLGEAQGVFTKRLDGYAPDALKRMKMSALDSSMHLALFGSTGTRKTSFIRGFLEQWVRFKVGGMLVLDEKDLPAELRGLKGYTLIEPGVKYAPLEGLNPTETVAAIFGAGHGDSKSSSSSAKFFETSASTMWLNGAVLVKALKLMETAKGLDDSTRRFRWTVSCIRGQIQRGLRGDAAMKGMLDGVKAGYRYENEGEQHMLEASIDYWEQTVPQMDAETKANVLATLLTWIDPIVSHPDLVAFAHIERSEGFNIADILDGGLYGVNLPENVFGLGGLVIASLVKQRVYKLLRTRGGSRNWLKLKVGGKRLAIVVDEAAGLVSDTDVAFLKVARDYGATCIFSVQNADAYAKKLGSTAAAETFIDNFRSEVCMASTEYTYQVLSHKLGHTRQPVWKGSTLGINFVRSMKILQESILLDPTHFGAKRMQTLLRRGAGQYKERGDGAHGFAGHKHYRNEDSAVEAVMKTDQIEVVEWKETPLLEKPEWDSYLAVPGVAVMQVLRGGVRRRDIVNFRSLQAFPADLLEAKDAPQPQVAFEKSILETSIELEKSDHKPGANAIPGLDEDSTAAMADATPTPEPTSDKVKP